jgi:RNA polymerase sigma factor (sigma-70 family)
VASEEEFVTELIDNHLRYMRKIARQFCKRLPQIDKAEILSAAYRGLQEAAGKWDTARGVSFAAFSRHFIRGRILDLGRLHLLDSLTDPIGDYDPLAPWTEPEEAIDRGIVARALRRAIDALEPDLQRLIEMRYLEEKTVQATIARMHIRASRYYTLESLALLQLEDRLENYMTKTLNNEKQRIDRALLKSVVDELGTVQDGINRFEQTSGYLDYKDAKKREGELKDHLKTCLPKDLPGEDSHSFEGNRYVVNISEARNERYVVDGGYKKIFGWLKERFFLKCSIPMKLLDCELNEEQAAEVIKKGHVGWRSYETERLKKEQRIAA